MANQQGNSFKDSLKVNVDHKKALADAKAKAQKASNSSTPGQKGNVGKTRGGQTR